MQVQWIGAAAENFRKGRPANYVPQAIVVHIIVGSLGSADEHFNDPQASVSAHYGVGKDGRIHQYVHETDTAFHAGIVVRPTWSLIKAGVNPNFYTVGIEHEGQPEDVWPDAQISASAFLIGEVAARWSIPLDTDHVVMHRQIRATKTCPGSFIQIPDLLKRIPGTGPQLVEVPVSLTLLSNLNLRNGAASTTAPIARVLPAGTVVSATGYILGEPVHGNPWWYCDSVTGCFFWAGGTNIPMPPGASV
jgi:N-acetylmuramoyl-L-alanine amidase